MRKALPATEFNPERRKVLRQGTIAVASFILGGEAGVFFGCGPDSPGPVDTCKMIDDFEDGNLISEPTGMTWSAMEGSNISTINGLLRIEGQRNAQGLIGAVLQQHDPRQALNTENYDTILADIRVGKVSNPYEPFTGKLTLEIEGFTRIGGSILSANYEGFAPGEFVTRHQVYSAPEMDPDYIIRFISYIRVYLNVADEELYFIEVDNLRLCLTGWSFIS